MKKKRRINLCSNGGTFADLLLMEGGDVLVVDNIVLDDGQVVSKKYQCLNIKKYERGNKEK